MGKTFLVGTISNTSRTAPAPRTRIYPPQSKKSVNLKMSISKKVQWNKGHMLNSTYQRKSEQLKF